MAGERSGSLPTFGHDPAPAPDRPAGPALSFTGLTDFMGQAVGAEQASDELPSGTLLGDVRIVRVLGAGGMGRVYEAVQDATQRTVAVKVIRSGIVSAAAARRLAHEAQILGLLSHPGIARIYSAGVALIAGRDTPYFVMEYVEQPRPITSFVAAKNLSRRERADLFRNVCLAVAHGHERGVVHRDLKPGNILVDADGQPKIIDFGVARCTMDEGQLTTMHTGTGELLGTAQYMAPEQLFGTADDIDARADVYALGLVFYELLTGSLPYEVSDRPIYEVARVVREVEPRSLAALDRGLRGDLTAIVATCLDKDRGRRYPSAAAIAADLGRHLRGEPIVARPPGFFGSLIRLANRHRAAAVGLGAVFTTLVVAAVGMSVLAVRAERQRDLATNAADLAERQLYRANVRSLQSFLESENPRAARMIFEETRAIVGDPLPLELLCLGDELDEALVVLKPDGNPVAAVSFSPDGSRLEATTALFDTDRPYNQVFALFRRRAEIFRLAQERQPARYAVAPGDAFVLIDAAADKPGGAPGLPERVLDRSPDGRQIELDADGRLMLRIMNPEVALIPLAAPRGRYASVAFAPGAQRLVVLDADHRLSLWNALDGTHVANMDVGAELDAYVFAPDGSRFAILRLLSGGIIRICVFEAEQGVRLGTIEIPGSLAKGELALAFSPDGRRLATAAHAAEILIWNSDDGAQEAEIEGHAAVITVLAWSADGGQLASGDRSGRICIWNLATGKLVRQCIGHSGDVLTLAFSPVGSRLASGGLDGQVRIWPTAATRKLATVPLTGEPLAVAFHPAGRQLAVAAAGSDPEVWSIPSMERMLRLPTAGGDPTEIVYSPNGHLVATAIRRNDGAGSVIVWDAATGKSQARIEDISRGPVTVRLSDDGSLLATTTEDGELTVWSLTGPRLLWRSRAAAYRSLARPPPLFALGGDVVAYKQPVLFDARTGRERNELGRSQIWSQAVSLDGRLLARGTATGRTYLYESGVGLSASKAMSGQKPSVSPDFVQGHADRVLAVAFDRLATRLATGSADGTARVWDVESLRECALLMGHEGDVTNVLFTPDGRRVVTSSIDGTTRIWDVTLGVELCQFPALPDRPAVTAVSPDGLILVTPSEDEAGPFLRLRGLTNATVTAARLAP